MTAPWTTAPKALLLCARLAQCAPGPWRVGRCRGGGSNAAHGDLREAGGCGVPAQECLG